MAHGVDELVEYLLAEIALCGGHGAGSDDFKRFVQKFYREAGYDYPAKEGFDIKLYEEVWNWVTSDQDIQILYHGEARDLSLSEFEAFELQENTTKTTNQDPKDGEEQTNQEEDNAVSTDSRPSFGQSAFRASLLQRIKAECLPLADPEPSSPTSPVDPTVIDIDSAKQQGASSHASGLAQSEVVATVQALHVPDLEHRDGNSGDGALVAVGSSGLDEVSAEGPVPVLSSAQAPETSRGNQQSSPDRKRGKRKFPKGLIATKPIFDDPSPNTTAPRIYASQNRTWKAVAGHSVDLVRIPAMQFVLLSIIMMRGPEGINQPDLVKISQQDPRSVPKRTTDLANKGYIEKHPVQAKGMKTSLLVHKKFLKGDHFLKGNVDEEEVFRNGAVIMSTFVKLLYNFLEDGKVVAVRNLRRNMGISSQDWHGRAIRTTLLRLSESGFLKRVRGRQQGARQEWVVCIKLNKDERPSGPHSDDIQNLRLHRHGPSAASPSRSTEEEDDGEDVMKQLELGLENLDEEIDVEAEHFLDEVKRIPPQWTPDRLITNMVFNYVEMTGPDGADGIKLRDRTTGTFWKRPTESYLTRLTDSWRKSQPPHLRHLTIIRDTAVTDDKKHSHYVYRSHGNFQMGVDAGWLDWDALEDPNTRATAGNANRKNSQNGHLLDPWGFQPLKISSFQQRIGSSTLAECQVEVSSRYRGGQSWDNELTERMGYDKPGTAGRKKTQASRNRFILQSKESTENELRRVRKFALGEALASGEPVEDFEIPGAPEKKPRRPVVRRNTPIQLLSAGQRIQLGLAPRGRLGQELETKIREYRETTGDLTAIPPDLLKRAQVAPEASSPGPKKVYPRRRLADGTLEPPLLTMAERRSRGLPLKGRLPTKVVDEIRLELGRSISSLTAYDGSKQDYDPEQLPKERKDTRMKETTPVPNDSCQDDTEMLQELVDPALEVGASDAHMTPVSRTAPSTKRKEIEMDESEQPMLKHIRSDKLATPAPVPPIALQSPESITAHGERTVDTSSRARTAEHYKLGDLAATSESPLAAVSIDTPQNDSSVAPGGAATRSVAPQINGEVSRSLDLRSPMPEQTKRKTKVQETYEAFNDRAMPGLYLNPYATRRAGRGRPPKAFMAVFKLARLRDFPWFQPDPTFVSQSSLGTVTTNKNSRWPWNNMAARIRNRVSTPTASQGIVAFESRKAPGASKLPVGSLHHALSPSVVLEGDLESNSMSTTARENASQTSIPHNAMEISPASLSAHTKEGVQLGQEGARLEDIELQCSTLSTNVVDPDCNTTSNTEDGILGDKRTPAASSDLGQGTTIDVASPITTTQKDIPKATRHKDTTAKGGKRLWPRTLTTPRKGENRGVVRGQGTSSFYRSKVILNVLAKCDGVCPGPSDMIPVINALWSQIPGSRLALPERGTLLRTIHSMIANKDIKRFKILLGNDNPTVERSIITQPAITGDSPQYIELRDKMIASYPKKYYPAQVRDLIGEELKKKEKVLPTIDPTIDLPSRYSSRGRGRGRGRGLNGRPKKTPEDRSMNTQKRREFDIGNAEAPTGRLDSLLVAKISKPPRRRNVEASIAPPMSTTSERHDNVHQVDRSRSPSPARSDSSEDIPLALIRPRQAHKHTSPIFSHEAGGGFALLPRRKNLLIDDSSEEDDDPDDSDYEVLEPPPATAHPDDELDDLDSSDNTSGEPSSYADIKEAGSLLSHLEKSLTNPEVRFDEVTGTFSTNFGAEVVHQSEQVAINPHSAKRPRLSGEFPDIADPPKKKRRVRKEAATGSTKFNSKRDPTLLERLTGLTGDQSQPVVRRPPKKKTTYRPGSRPYDQNREYVKKSDIVKPRTVDDLNPVNCFKKLLCTLVVASSMSAEEGLVDWSIVSKVYGVGDHFDVEKTKKVWSWVRDNMATELEALSSDFQSRYLEAYEKGEVPEMEDPDKHDWLALVVWAFWQCEYPSPPLRAEQEELLDYFVDESTWRAFNHEKWIKKHFAHKYRVPYAQKLIYADPIHPQQHTTQHKDDDTLRARSWLRANTATPEDIYNANEAHSKLATLDEEIYRHVVNGLVDRKMIHQRKQKRLMPGRNFDFVAEFGKNYKHNLDVDDFMEAVKFKKSLDRAFSAPNEEDRVATVSRTAEHGATMALLSMVSGGMVRIVPRLPPTDNTVEAPRPRVSVWGFAEGDYRHRFIDREQMFWTIDIEPTSDYAFGNPLKPFDEPSLAVDSSGEARAWTPLPEPPLPGKEDPQAALPIWSSINGKSVTWPWWCRILDLVLHFLIFKPGHSAAQIFSLIEEDAAELFEVELVLEWLVQVRSVRQTSGTSIKDGTFEILPTFWGVFGDSAIFTDEEDWYQRHSKKKRKSNEPKFDHWTLRYNASFAQSLRAATANAGKVVDRDDSQQQPEVTDNPFSDQALRNAILKNPRQQYRILKRREMQLNKAAAAAATTPPAATNTPPATTTSPVPNEYQDNISATPLDGNTPTTEDVDMEDVDAEGESDDEYL